MIANAAGGFLQAWFKHLEGGEGSHLKCMSQGSVPALGIDDPSSDWGKEAFSSFTGENKMLWSAAEKISIKTQAP